MSRKHKIDIIRNIGISAHIDAGKTTTTERILFYSGRSHKIGEVHDGAATMDFMDQEKERGITIQSASTQCEWNNTYKEAKHKHVVINIIDTPGHVDFTIEVERSLRVLDGAIIVLEGVSGVEPQTMTVFRQADKYKLPRLIYINKMDRMGANFEYVLGTIEKKLTSKYVVLNMPVGSESEFSGMIDIIRMVYFHWDEGSRDFVVKEIPNEEYRIQADQYRETLLERLGNVSDDVLNLMLEGKEVPEALIYSTLRKATIAQELIPVLCGSSFKNKGVHQLLDAVADFFPAPNERGDYIGTSYKQKDEKIARKPEDSEKFSAFIFKVVPMPNLGEVSLARVYSGVIKPGTALLNTNTGKKTRVGRILVMHANRQEEVASGNTGDIVALQGLQDISTGVTICNVDDNAPIIYDTMSFPAPVISQKITPNTKQDDQKLAKALGQMTKEDPSFIVTKEFDETIISGMGSLHLEIKVDILRRTHGVNLTVGEPSVNYKETPATNGELDYELKKQTGGAGQYARMTLVLEKDPNYKKNNFINKIVGGKIDTGYIPSIEAGIKDAMKNGGPIGRYEILGYTITLTDGRTHAVDSSADTFKLAAIQAVRELLKKVGTILLEPLMEVAVYIPHDYMGMVIGDLNGRGGLLGDTIQNQNTTIINATVPLRAMHGYIDFLRAATSGTGSFTMEPKQDEDSNSVYAPVPQELVPVISKSREHIHYRS